MSLAPVAYWRLGEPSGPTAYDVSGNGRSLNLSGGYTQNVTGALSGDSDAAMSFDGSTGYGLVGSLSSAIAGGSISLACWGKLLNNPATFQGLCGFRHGDTLDCDFYILQDSGTDQVECRMRTSSSNVATLNAAVTASVYHLIVFVYDNTAHQLHLYVDGSEVSGSPIAFTGPITDAGVPFAIGMQAEQSGNANFFGGSLDDIALFNYALSAGDVTALWQAGSAASGTNLQDVTGDWKSDPAARTFRGIDQVRPLETIRAGSTDLELWNASRNYSAENSASPLAGKLHAGVQTQMQVLYQGSTYPISSGILDDLPQNPELPKTSVSVPSLGPLSRLRIQGNATQPMPISTQLYQSITTDQALGYLLDAIGFPPFKRKLAAGNTVLDWWWLDNEDAFTAAQQLINSEGPGARLYEDGAGNIVFENRWYRWLQTRSTTSQITFNPVGAEPLHMPPFNYSASSKDVVNVCTVTQVSRSVKALAKVWSAPTTPATISIPPNVAQPFIATSSDPFLNAVVPVQGTDFTLNNGSVSSVTISQTSGARTTVTITAGATGATISGLQLRAQPVSVDSSTDITNQLNTQASQNIYKQRLYPLQIRQEINANVLQGFCDAICLWFQSPIPHLQITVLASANTTRLLQALTREISDRVTLVETQTGLNGDCWIESEEHQIANAGFEHIWTVGLDRVPNLQPFILDVTPMDGVLATGQKWPATLWW